VTLPSTYMPIADKAMDLAAGLVRAHLPTAVNTKGDRDMVSDVDIEIERVVRDYLHERSPEIGFLGEEEGTAPAATDGAGLRWVLDPIDGTANFVKGIPLYSISLALVNDEEPVLGIIDIPAEGCRYTAIKGLGAYSGRTRIQVRPTARMADAVVTMGDYAVGEQAEMKNQIRLAVTRLLAERAQRVRMLGSAAIDLAWLAHGRTDASITFGNNPWDTAAGVILVREADGHVVDADGKRHSMRSGSTIAANRELLDDLLDLISSIAQGGNP
jgi:myo-inositol-1(or 4)-monophosphatase